MDISVKNAIAISFAAGVVAGCSLTLLLLTLYKINRLPKQRRQQQQRPEEEEEQGLDALDISPPLESSTALLAQGGPPHFSTFFGPSDDYLPMSVRIYENEEDRGGRRPPREHFVGEQANPATAAAATFSDLPRAPQPHNHQMC